MDRGTWQATVPRVAKSHRVKTGLSNNTFTFFICKHLFLDSLFYSIGLYVFPYASTILILISITLQVLKSGSVRPPILFEVKIALSIKRPVLKR